MKRLCFRICLVIGLITILLMVCPACQRKLPTDKIWTEKELLSCSKVYIRNRSTPPIGHTGDVYRTVTDEALKKRLCKLCGDVEIFRSESKVLDQLVGGNIEPSVYFYGEGVRCVITTIESEKQLAIDYVYRDAPLVLISIQEAGTDGRFEKYTNWLCQIPAADYSNLFDILFLYGDGEVVDALP